MCWSANQWKFFRVFNYFQLFLNPNPLMRNNLLVILVLALFSHVLIGQSRVQSSNQRLTSNRLILDAEATGNSFVKTSLKLALIDQNGGKTSVQTTDFKLKEANPETDPYGLQHYHYTQTINGIEVDGAEMRVHVKNGTVESQTGSWLLEVTPRLQSLRASQSADAILQAVENSLKGKKISSQTLTTAPVGNGANARVAATPDNAKLVYVPIGRDLENIRPDSVRLAYRFTVKVAPFGNFMYYVDATNGEVLYKIDMVCRIMGAKNHVHTMACEATTPTESLVSTPTLAPPPAVTESIDANSTLWTRYSGSQRTITTKRSDGKWALKDLSRNIAVLNFDSIEPDNSGGYTFTGSPYLNTSNQWRLTSDKDIAGYTHDALWGGQATYDYYKTTLGRWLYTSGRYGQKLNIYANTDLTDPSLGQPSNANAFYDGEQVVIGRGDPANGINPLSALDVMAHEITHGVTQNTSGLRYINESGAINEALSDIFGTAVERFKRPQRWNWTMGEDIGFILRSMSNPRAYEQPGEYGGQYFLNYGSNPGIDNGGVHINSGIMNRWFYLLCAGGKGTTEAGNAYNVTGISMDDAIKIVFLAQTDYITSGMSYYNVSLATFRAARDIFGQNANQTKQVQNAWLAVNVSKAVIYKNCADTHEPNNSSQKATQINVDTPVQGNLEDFAYSEYNKGDYSKGLLTPNASQYSDWYTFTTTNEKPNIQLQFKTYFADVVSVVVFKDNGELIDKASSNKGNGEFVSNTLQAEIGITINDVKSRKYRVRINYGNADAGDIDDIRWNAINKQSNGCYEFVVNSSAKPYDVIDNVKEFSDAINSLIDGQFFYMLNLNDAETKRYKVLSLPDDKQMQDGVKAVQRNYDNQGDQIWQVTNREYFDNDRGAGHMYSVKNLNTDKVLEFDSKGNVYQKKYEKTNPNQRLGINPYGYNGKQGWYLYDSLSVKGGKKFLSAVDTISKSPVKMAYILSEHEGAGPGNVVWVFYNASLPDGGEYIIRSVKDKRSLTWNITLKTETYTEAANQRWKLTYDKDGRYSITNSATQKALNLTNANPADNATYDLATLNPKQDNQRWKVLPTGRDGTFKLANSATNKTVTTKTNGTATQYTYAGLDSQRWYFDKVQTLKEGYYFVQNRATGLYIDIPGSSKENGTNPISYAYRGTYNQLFYVQPQKDGSYIIENVTSDKALSINNQTALAKPYQWETNPTAVNHRWQVVYTTDGYFKIISKFSGQVLPAGTSAGTAGNTSPIVQNNYQLNNYYQQWNFRILGSPKDKTVQTLAQTSESVSAENTESLLLFPNPTQNQVTVVYDLTEGEQAEIKLMSLTGMELKSQPAEAKQTVIDVSAFGTGVYLINLKTNTGKRLIQKLIISK